MNRTAMAFNMPPIGKALDANTIEVRIGGNDD